MQERNIQRLKVCTDGRMVAPSHLPIGEFAVHMWGNEKLQVNCSFEREYTAIGLVSD